MRYGTGTRGALEAIVNELLTRSAALLFIQDRPHNGIEMRTYGPAGRALPVFADMRCLRWAAEDLGKLARRMARSISVPFAHSS